MFAEMKQQKVKQAHWLVWVQSANVYNIKMRELHLATGLSLPTIRKAFRLTEASDETIKLINAFFVDYLRTERDYAQNQMSILKTK